MCLHKLKVSIKLDKLDRNFFYEKCECSHDKTKKAPTFL